MMISGKKIICVTAIVVLALTTGAWAEDPYEVAWKAQIGTGASEYGSSVAVDTWGNAFITGQTRGNLGGVNAGGSDVYVSKFDSGGNELWTTQFGTSDHDRGYSVAVDASGNAYITGYTKGDLGGSNVGSYDVFVSKLDSGGNDVWTSQFGTSGEDIGNSLALDASGNVYISGQTLGDLGGPNAGSYDAFLSKLDSDGNEVWTSQFGTSAIDRSLSVAVDASGNAYTSGYTGGNLGGPNVGDKDAFLGKFDSAGNEVWTTQFGTSERDESWSVAVDASGNSFIIGRTRGDLGGPNAGDYDVFLGKFNSDGNEVWTTQIGTNALDWGQSVAVDAWGNAYITGYTKGDLVGPNAGGYDAFLSKFNSGGDEVWTTQFGTNDHDWGDDVVLDASGNIYLVGDTTGDFGRPYAGDMDPFLVKYEVPEPATLSLLMLGGLTVLRRRRKR